MTNPFEQAAGTFHVLMNAEGQYSLWPSFIQVPAGWQVIVDTQAREACVAYINTHWTDLKPRSLGRITSALHAQEV
ncbi:MbtH protein [Paenibacillus cellulosilyticus]|uniref:MbtH protein n=1 Tax=Paenibacillus cellulosilyticus TaxID=375489 RepID=A0A2V2YKI7_9BACL|nr:MbtH family protein [Paenibacillus cellulosilyticus]PWV93782.1 MbtH protein [Paenibacillus cellulosilyticus]QKS47401.1 MbtH family NRPS accessory protein [Paenibacillus cellulosilyticus]